MLSAVIHRSCNAYCDNNQEKHLSEDKEQWHLCIWSVTNGDNNYNKPSKWRQMSECHALTNKLMLWLNVSITCLGPALDFFKTGTQSPKGPFFLTIKQVCDSCYFWIALFFSVSFILLPSSSCSVYPFLLILSVSSQLSWPCCLMCTPPQPTVPKPKALTLKSPASSWNNVTHNL